MVTENKFATPDIQVRNTKGEGGYVPDKKLETVHPRKQTYCYNVMLTQYICTYMLHAIRLSIYISILCSCYYL